jgi:hypothetical protein
MTPQSFRETESEEAREREESPANMTPQSFRETEREEEREREREGRERARTSGRADAW